MEGTGTSLLVVDSEVGGMGAPMGDMLDGLTVSREYCWVS